jgi:hypothetical protein
MVSMMTAAMSRPLRASSIAARSLNGTLRELVGVVGQEELGEAVVPGADGKAGMTVVRLDDGQDLALAGRMPRRLQRDVDGLAPSEP